MRPVLAPAGIAALGVAVVLFLSLALSSVLSVTTMMGRYPEAMLDYVLPVLTTSVAPRALSVVAFALAAFGASVLLLRVTTTVLGAVGRGVLISVIATVVSGIAVFEQIRESYPTGGSLRGLAEVLVSAGNTVGQLFIAGTPLVVLASVLVVSYLRARSLTAPQPV